MRALIFACVVAALPAPAIAWADGDLNCEIGPVSKVYGGTQWLVYGCNEDRHLQFVSALGNPAESVMMLFWDNGHWTVLDIGTGDKRAVQAAREEIQALSEPEIMTLIAETRSR